MFPARFLTRRRRLLSGLCIFGLFASGSLDAATISFSPGVSSVLPGGSFTVDIYGTSINPIGGFSLYLNASSSGSEFQITAYALNTSLFNFGGPSPSFPDPISSTIPSHDLGAFSNSSLAANTQYLLGTATITAAIGAAPAVYAFGNTANTVFANPAFTVSDFASVSSFHVAVVPEPSKFGLLVAGFLAVVLFRFRLRTGHLSKARCKLRDLRPDLERIGPSATKGDSFRPHDACGRSS